MEVVKIILQIAGFLGISSLFTLYITERIKNKIKNSFDIKLEEVKMINSKEISQFQSELNHLKSKENFKFTKLHEKRFEVLQETYKFLNETIKFLEAYVEPIDKMQVDKIDKLAMKKEYVSSDENFSEYFNLNKIFFTKEISDLLERYFVYSKDVFYDYAINEFLSKPNKTYVDELAITASNAHIKLTEKIEPIKIEIENEFRKLLGE